MGDSGEQKTIWKSQASFPKNLVLLVQYTQRKVILLDKVISLNMNADKIFANLSKILPVVRILLSGNQGYT